MSRTKPDVAMSFNRQEIEGASVAVIAVRPESNKVSYESVILRAISPYAELIYMANLSGIVVKNSKIIESQYKLQNKFAKNGKPEFLKYKELCDLFEAKFGIPAKDANIIGAFEAISKYKHKLHKSDQELFHTIVGEEDFLEAFGHTIKKIDEYYIVNYDMPAVFSEHNKETDIFVIAVRLHDPNAPFYNLNRSIYEEFEKNNSITIIDSKLRASMEWFNQVRRTYHISNSHIKAMFDMTDYILDSEGNHLEFNATPLGCMLIERGQITDSQLQKIKDNPMVTIKIGEEHKLINILTYAQSSDSTKSLQQCCELIESIIFEEHHQNVVLV